MKEIDKKIRNDFGLKFVEDIEGSMKQGFKKCKTSSGRISEYRIPQDIEKMLKIGLKWLKNLPK